MTAPVLESSRLRRSLPDPTIRKLIRVRAGLSQEEVAEAVGVERSAVTRWESGARTPRKPYLDLYAALLDELAREVLR